MFQWAIIFEDQRLCMNNAEIIGWPKPFFSQELHVESCINKYLEYALRIHISFTEKLFYCLKIHRWLIRETFFLAMIMYW